MTEPTLAMRGLSVAAKVLKLTLTICVVSLAANSQAIAEYRLNTGDTLDISVFGVADFKRHVTVNIDGDLSLPFLGEVRASGLSLPELRARIAENLVAKRAILKPEVTVELVEHRPFYISGDVARPGALAYRPGLNVRRAIALAGGYDVLRFRTENLQLAAPDLRSQNSALWADLFKTQARQVSVQAELDEKREADYSALKTSHISDALFDDIVRLEKELLQRRADTFGKQAGFAKQAISEADRSFELLKDVLEQQKKSVELQESISESFTNNNKKGLLPVTRAIEEARNLASYKIQMADTQIRLADSRKARSDLEGKFDTLIADRRSKLTQDLQDTVVEINRLRSLIEASREKLLFTGALKSQLARNKQGIQLVIYRKTATGEQRLLAFEDTEMFPDDYLEVTVSPDDAMLASPGIAPASAQASSSE